MKKDYSGVDYKTCGDGLIKFFFFKEFYKPEVVIIMSSKKIFTHLFGPSQSNYIFFTWIFFFKDYFGHSLTPEFNK